MKNRFILLTVLILSFFFHSCYVPRGIKTPVTIKVMDGFNCDLHSYVPAPQYLYYKTADEYRDAFIEDLKSETSLSKNVTIITNDSIQPDYILKITHLAIDESDRNETVNDAKSPDNGNTYVLATCEAKASFDWYKTSNGQKIASSSASAMKSEKVKNSRNLIQLTTGTNKDNTLYREKTLPEDACLTVVKKCGRHTWSAASVRLARYFKKGK